MFIVAQVRKGLGLPGAHTAHSVGAPPGPACGPCDLQRAIPLGDGVTPGSGPVFPPPAPPHCHPTQPAPGCLARMRSPSLLLSVIHLALTPALPPSFQALLRASGTSSQRPERRTLHPHCTDRKDTFQELGDGHAATSPAGTRDCSPGFPEPGRVGHHCSPARRPPEARLTRGPHEGEVPLFP